MPRPKRHVLVCLHERPADGERASCARRGSEDLFVRLKRLVSARGLEHEVIVSRTGCLKHCSRGVTVAVYPENVWYAGVGAADLEEIVDTHLRDGIPIERLLMPDIPWE
jgi:(2Fe-2S) ferredoxin